MSGVLEAIWIKRARRGPMDAAQRVTLVTGGGIVGNANQGGKRQVTIVSREVFEALRRTLDERVDPVMRRANLLVSGVTLTGSRGRVLTIGRARVRVHGETRPCHIMDEALPGLRAALEPEWRGGVFGEVLGDAEIEVGDAVGWEA